MKFQTPNVELSIQACRSTKSGSMSARALLWFAVTSLFLLQQHPVAAALSTSGRWIVDESGKRVKLACINWVSHLEVMVPEGLNKQPLDAISKSIASMGFNCVRLTWPVYLLTNNSLKTLTVRQSFFSLGLVETIAAIKANNPAIIDLHLLHAFKAVVNNLGANNVMVILDNQVSKPGWCCSKIDGNGFFGDEYFNPDLWVEGLSRMASLFKNSANVIGMSLRNELRGSNQTVNGWYKYMQRGAEAVHLANPNVLTIFSGLDFDTDLSFLLGKQVQLSFSSKLVFEIHWYSFSNTSEWENNNTNQICGSLTSSFMTKGGFLLSQGWPLFLSEFGIDQRGINTADNRFIGCLLGLAAELDVDWALWTLQGSYYLREGVISMEEFYGVLSYSWKKQRNPSFLQRISTLQAPFQGPGLSNAKPYKILFHQATGLCVRRASHESLYLGTCNELEVWDYTEQHTLALRGTNQCLRAIGEGENVELGYFCSDSASYWEPISDSMMHVSTKLAGNYGSRLCLDIDLDGGTLVTNVCQCIGIESNCEPENQWFKIIDSNRHAITLL